MPSIEDKLQQNVVMVRGQLLGTGFFIGNDGTLLTCFHVVGDKETGKLADNLTVTFKGKEYLAKGIFIPHTPNKLDVAVLRLNDGKLPDKATLLPLGKWGAYSQYTREFRSYGFRTPAPNSYEGLYAEGNVRGRVTRRAGVKLLQLASEAMGQEEVRQGMSGAPVYMESANQTGQIVGMITSWVKKEGVETIPFALPLEEIAEIWPPIKARLLEEELLQQFSKILRPGEWFTEKTLKYFYESLPIPNLVRYDDLGEDKQQALHEQIRVKGQRRIFDLVNWLRSKRPDIPIQKLIDLPPVHRFNFVNREDELKEACGSYAVPYILFEAPAGYGKTELLKTIEQRHFRDGWVCVYVKTPKDTESAIELANQIARQVDYSNFSSLPDANAIGYALGGVLKNRINVLDARGVILLIDNVENLPESQIDDFVNHFLVAIHSVLQESKLRVRLAGRYIGSLWKKQEKELKFPVKSLTPFRFKYVKTTVQIMLPTHQEPDLCAAYLMHITGGHPGCMAKIIEHINTTQPVEEHFKENQDKYKDIVLSVANKIRSSIPEPLQDIFDVLSIFRRYNLRLLQKMIESNLIEYEGGADTLEKKLNETYLVERKNGFIQDEIVRRLLAIRLRWEDFDRFIERCKNAQQIYAQDLHTVTSRPEFIAIEALYQELQLIYYQGKQTLEERKRLRDAFLADEGILHRYIKVLKGKKEARDIKADFKTQLKNEDSEWEFQFAINFFLRGKQYSNAPYRAMLKRVDEFFTL